MGSDVNSHLFHFETVPGYGDANHAALAVAAAIAAMIFILWFMILT
jgi:hypothetical protein